MAKDLFYWDANSFSGYLNAEPDKIAECEVVLKEAEKGHVLIVTSALTLAEVLHIKNGPRLDASDRETIDQFFKADYIAVRNVTRSISDIARDVYWDFGIEPKDAVHIATAAFHKIPIIHTFDRPLIARNGIIVANHALRIESPHISYQPALDLEDTQDDKD